jgi:hypothetical protein
MHSPFGVLRVGQRQNNLDGARSRKGQCPDEAGQQRKEIPPSARYPGWATPIAAGARSLISLSRKLPAERAGKT